MGYKWLPVTEDFDKSLVIKKWRFDVSIPITGHYDGALSELPNIDIKTCWNNSRPENGYAFGNRFNLGQKYFTSRYYGFTDGYWTATTSSHTTLVSGTTYEFECPVDLYWAGNNTTPWNANIPNYMWFYVQASTFEIEPTDSAATYESGTTTITVNTDNDTSITWTASTNDSWLSLSTLTGAGDGTVVVSYEGNQSFQNRTGTVTFTSNEGDVLTFTIEQEKKPVLVYDHPIYRSGNLVKKMYRSGEMIYLRLNPPSEEPVPPTPPEPTYQWVEVTADFDRSLPFTKVRWDFSKSWYDGFFSELPNINCDNMSWTSIEGAEWGYAGQYTMNLSAKKCYIRNQSTDSYALYDMYSIATQVDTNLYEYEYSVPLYWGGVSSSYLYNNGLGLYVYVEVNPTNE